MEEKLAEVKSEYADKVARIAQDLKVLQNHQGEQLKEVSQLQASWNTRLQQRLEDANQRHNQEINKVKEELQLQSEKDMSAMKDEHQRELDILKSELKLALKQQQSQMSSTHQLLLEERARESEELLQKQLAEQEGVLTNQISTLTAYLRKAQDNLALSEQKKIEILSQLEKEKKQSTDLQAHLQALKNSKEELEAQLHQLKNDIEISQDLYQKQKSEMDKMASKDMHLFT